MKNLILSFTLIFTTIYFGYSQEIINGHINLIKTGGINPNECLEVEDNLIELPLELTFSVLPQVISFPYDAFHIQVSNASNSFSLIDEIINTDEFEVEYTDENATSSELGTTFSIGCRSVKFTTVLTVPIPQEICEGQNSGPIIFPVNICLNPVLDGESYPLDWDIFMGTPDCLSAIYPNSDITVLDNCEKFDLILCCGSSSPLREIKTQNEVILIYSINGQLIQKSSLSELSNETPNILPGLYIIKNVSKDGKISKTYFNGSSFSVNY